MSESTTYRLFYRSMAERKPVVCVYQGYPRAVCPIVLGHTGREEKALVHQFDGGSGSGRTKGWKCLTLAEVTRAELTDAPWQDGGGPHGTAQSCVKDVDVDINPASPYGPKRKLPWQ